MSPIEPLGMPRSNSTDACGTRWRPGAANKYWASPSSFSSFGCAPPNSLACAMTGGGSATHCSGGGCSECTEWQQQQEQPCCWPEERGVAARGSELAFRTYFPAGRTPSESSKLRNRPDGAAVVTKCQGGWSVVQCDDRGKVVMAAQGTVPALLTQPPPPRGGGAWGFALRHQVVRRKRARRLCLSRCAHVLSARHEMGFCEFARKGAELHAPDKSDVVPMAVDRNLVKRVATIAATVLALYLTRSAVLGLWDAIRKGRVHGQESLGVVWNPNGTRSSDTKIVGVVPVVLRFGPQDKVMAGMAGPAGTQERCPGSRQFS